MKSILIALVWVVTLIFLAYSIANWRGKRAWNAVKADLEKRGQIWQFSELVPKPVPPGQNFASIPLATNWFDIACRTNSIDGKHPLSIAGSKLGKPKRDRTQLEPMVPTDLIAWARAIKLGTNSASSDDAPDIPPTPPEESTPEARAQAASVVLAAMAADESVFAQIREALHRPHSRYPIDYEIADPWSILLPHLAKVKMWSQRLAMQASAELALGKTDQALQDIETILDFQGTLGEEPFLISYLVRMAILKIACQPVWEGLQEHRWSDPQLKALMERFSKFDFVTGLEQPLAMERAAAVKTLELVRRRGELAGNFVDSDSATITLARIIPSGWFYFEMANYSRIMDRLIWAGVDLKTRRVYPEILRTNADWFHGTRANPLKVLLRHELAAGIFLPELTKAARKSTQAQALADFAILACALERYRIQSGQLPTSLEALTPGCISALPKDWITGLPYHYRKTDNSYVLYSVGWDEKNGSGDTRLVKGEETAGDWVWGCAFP